MTKIKVVKIPVSMLPRLKQIESSDLKLGTCVDELVPALRAEIKKANEESDAIKEWQEKEVKRYSEEKPFNRGVFFTRRQLTVFCLG